MRYQKPHDLPEIATCKTPKQHSNASHYNQMVDDLLDDLIRPDFRLSPLESSNYNLLLRHLYHANLISILIPPTTSPQSRQEWASNDLKVADLHCQNHIDVIRGLDIMPSITHIASL